MNPSVDSASGLSPEKKKPIGYLDWSALRQKLLAFTDPLDPKRAPTLSLAEQANLKYEASRFVTILAHLFGPDLDRKTLWERIHSALETALAKVYDEDTDRFIHLCLEHVRAEIPAATSCEALNTVIQTWRQRPVEWRHALLHYLRSHRYVVLLDARNRWEGVKKGEIEL